MKKLIFVFLIVACSEDGIKYVSSDTGVDLVDMENDGNFPGNNSSNVDLACEGRINPAFRDGCGCIGRRFEFQESNACYATCSCLGDPDDSVWICTSECN